MKPTSQLTPSQVENFGRELDALLARTKADLGERDVRYIKRVIRTQRLCEVAGRALLFAGIFAPTWIPGVLLLSLSKIIENMEVGHNVMHGQYDFARDPSILSATYEWDNVCPASQWKHSHNFVHHTFTNVRDRDHDLGYRLLRIDEAQPWRWTTFFQPFYALGLAAFFQWGVATHDLDLRLYLADSRSRSDADREKFREIGRKVRRQVLKDYVLFPLLAGPYALHILAGNLVANVVRNVWAFSVIFCGHFPDGAKIFPPESLEGETRAAFYLRQMQGSANFEGSRVLYFLSGHLSHQIEHHLFPDIPAHRYPEIGREVRAISAKYGVAYNTGSFSAQLFSVARKIVRLAWPPPRSAAVSGA